MKVFNVGNKDQDLGRIDLDKKAYHWFVYEYNWDSEMYEGSGLGVALRKADGLVDFNTLGHNSCYEALDKWNNAQTMTVEEFLTLATDNIFDDIPGDALKAKVRQLMALPPR